MNTKEIKKMDRQHVVYSWKAQGSVDPIVIDRAEGIYMWDTDGKRYIDGCSGLLNINIGHSNRQHKDRGRQEQRRTGDPEQDPTRCPGQPGALSQCPHLLAQRCRHTRAVQCRRLPSRCLSLVHCSPSTASDASGRGRRAPLDGLNGAPEAL